MQNFIVNLKDSASDADVADAKKSIESQGGKVNDVSAKDHHTGGRATERV